MSGTPLLLLAIVVVPVAVALLVIGWPRWRLRRLARTPFPPAWEATLHAQLPPWRHFEAEEQVRMRALIRRFLLDKRFFGCGGLTVTESMRLLIAAQACLLQLHRRDGDLYPGLRYILVYPDAFVAPRIEYLPGGVELIGEQDLEGESWSDGKLILSWDDVERDLAEFGDGRNVTLHEFAHQLDDESGGTNGAPPLPGAAASERWHAVMSAAYERLLAVVETPGEQGRRAWPGRCATRHSAIDPYGATSPAEFFAVITEHFFTQPARLAAAEPAVFAELVAFYGIDPHGWQLAAPAAAATG